MSIQLGDTVYVCGAETPADHDLEWTQGKDVQAKVAGKTLTVKRANGKAVKLHVISSSKAS